MRSSEIKSRLHKEIEISDVYTRQLESKLHCAYAFMVGTWQPDDIDRQKFVESIKDLLQIGEDNE